MGIAGIEINKWLKIAIVILMILFLMMLLHVLQQPASQNVISNGLNGIRSSLGYK